MAASIEALIQSNRGYGLALTEWSRIDTGYQN